HSHVQLAYTNFSTRKTADDYDLVCYSSWSASRVGQQRRPCRPRTRPALRDVPQALFFIRLNKA
ncbi:hypothetical protein EXIGLDRAFT_720640, partial [Exidia glandulosa HHB12029]